MSDIDHEHWMRIAIDAARDGISAGQSPFGAAIVRDDRLIIAAHNVVWAELDITAHAEVHALRQACRLLQTVDLSGCDMYATTEPCPMCFAACHWARCRNVIFGSEIAEAQAAGFNELTIPSEVMKLRGGSRIGIVSGVLREQCAALFREWLGHPQRRTY